MQAALILLAIVCVGVSLLLVHRRLHEGSGAASRRIAPWVGGLDREPEAAPVTELVDEVVDEPSRRRVAMTEALELAEIDTDLDRFLLQTVVGTVAGVIVASVIVSPFLGAIVLVAAPLSVRAYVLARVKRRRAAFADQLAEAVQTIAGAMRAGHGLSASMAMVADDSPEPMASELRRITSSERLGISLETALAEAAERTGSRDLENLGLIATLQRDVGGNGAEALESIVETIRRRDDLRRLVTALTAQGRMSRWVLTALPVALAGVLLVIGHGFLSPLWTEAVGRTLTVVAVMLVIVGSYWIKRIVEIEV